MADSETYRRRAPTRIEVMTILLSQGADVSGLELPRGALSEKAIWNAIEAQGFKIPCGHCSRAITKRNDCRRDHKISLRSVAATSRAEHDMPWNQWYLCLDCDRTKTSKRGLKGLGSDAARIAKLRRIEKGRAPCRQIQSIPSRPFPKPSPTSTNGRWPQGQTIQSRPFPKRDKKTEK